MAETRDEELRARYRALATEEPSAAIDDAIRAAARRGVSAGPGVRRASSTRWAVPVSIAAVVFLSFGVVLQMQEQVPPLQIESAPLPKAEMKADEMKAEMRMAEPPPAKPVPVEREKKRILAEEPKPAAPAPQAFEQRAPAPMRVPAPVQAPAPKPAVVPAEAPAAAALPPASPPVPAAPSAATAPPARAFADSVSKPQLNVVPRPDPARSQDSAAAAPAPRAKAEAFSSQRGAEGAVGAVAKERAEPWPDTPEKKLERIAELRKAGRDREAEEALARFKREHPDYRIPDAIWERIRPR